HGKRILASGEHLVAVDLDRRGRPVGGIDEAAVRVHVNGAGSLPATDVAGLGQRLLAEDRRRRKLAIGDREHVELALALERYVDPGLARVEVEMARPEAVPAVRRHR